MIKKNLYECHVFVCTNKRPEGHPRGCCADKGSEKLRMELKTWAQEKYGRRVRINSSGCLDFCELGISTVIYPDGEWHLKLTPESIDELKQAIDKRMENLPVKE